MDHNYTDRIHITALGAGLPICQMDRISLSRVFTDGSSYIYRIHAFQRRVRQIIRGQKKEVIAVICGELNVKGKINIEL